MNQMGGIRVRHIRKHIQQLNLGYLLDQVTLGLEKEGQRVTPDGQIARTPHSATFGSRSIHPYIQTDFAESQLELVTPTVSSAEDVIRWMAALHDVVLRTLPHDEYMWPLSIPAGKLDANQIQVAMLESTVEREYREYLAEKYGKSKQMVSGIHYNVGLHPQLIDQLAISQGYHSQAEKIEFKNQLYMMLTKAYFYYEWILVYLLGAAPVAEEGYFRKEEQQIEQPVKSIRSSSYGYVNKEEVVVSYETLQDYVESVESMVQKGYLRFEKELYRTVRFRGGKTARELLTNGIQYIELRSFDLNPYALYGIEQEDIRFIQLFLMTLLWMDRDFTNEDVLIGAEKKEKTALSHPLASPLYMEEMEELFQHMLEMIETLQLPTYEQDQALVRQKMDMMYAPKLTIVGRMWEEIQQGISYATFGMKKAKQLKDVALYEPFALKGFTNMELSTQIILFDAIQKGLQIELLDESDQFIALTYAGRSEYIKNGNMTSADSVSSMLAMANKVVTKKILHHHGFHVPSGYECAHVQEADALWELVKQRAIVIKPKTTNYGLGITIFKQTPTEADFKQAVRIAFKEDTTILIEEFIEGTEYRFFVLNGETKAVLLRKPAQVVGDGVSTVEQLVQKKNEHAYRGEGHQYPLTIIQLGEIEQLLLKQQGYTIHSIPEKEEVVYLRENSNISTGGDSVDVTEEMHEDYKKIAAEAVVAMKATISGVDLIIKDLTSGAKRADWDKYAIIEANFNPAMMMQVYPLVGKGRRLSLDVLSLLFPEIQ